MSQLLPTARLAAVGVDQKTFASAFLYRQLGSDVHESATIRAFGDEHQTAQPPARLNGAQPSRDALL
ncbi:hypothetical protein, partial [Lentzea nigeriaca]